MNEWFKAVGMGLKPWTVTDDAILIKDTRYPFSEISIINIVSTPTTPLTNGVVQMSHGGRTYTLAFKFADKDRAHSAVSFAKDAIDVAHGAVKDYKYKLLSHTGSYLEVYEDYLTIYFMPVGSLMANLARGGTTGGKKLNYADITSIQFMEPTISAAGFMSFSYPGSVENKGGVTAAVNDENSIVFRADKLPLAKEIYDFIEGKRDEARKAAHAPGTVVQQVSAADEIKKFKELLDMGIITQEEFDAKKKSLLGL